MHRPAISWHVERSNIRYQTCRHSSGRGGGVVSFASSFASHKKNPCNTVDLFLVELGPYSFANIRRDDREWDTPHSNPAALLVQSSPFPAKVLIPWLWLHVIALGTPDFIGSAIARQQILIHLRKFLYPVDFAENTHLDYFKNCG